MRTILSSVMFFWRIFLYIRKGQWKIKFTQKLISTISISEEGIHFVRSITLTKSTTKRRPMIYFSAGEEWKNFMTLNHSIWELEHLCLPTIRWSRREYSKESNKNYKANQFSSISTVSSNRMDSIVRLPTWKNFKVGFLHPRMWQFWQELRKI